MKQNKDSFKCIYEMGIVYGYLSVSIGFFFMSILMVLIILIEKIYSIYLIIFSVVFALLGLIKLSICIFYRDKKLIINSEKCKVESRKGILFLCKTHSIRRIVILVMPRGGKQYIIFDCEEYPFLLPQDFIYLNTFCIRFTSCRLKNIRKYCPDCKLETEVLSPWVKR